MCRKKKHEQVRDQNVPWTLHGCVRKTHKRRPSVARCHPRSGAKVAKSVTGCDLEPEFFFGDCGALIVRKMCKEWGRGEEATRRVAVEEPRQLKHSLAAPSTRRKDGWWVQWREQTCYCSHDAQIFHLVKARTCLKDWRESSLFPCQWLQIEEFLAPSICLLGYFPYCYGDKHQVLRRKEERKQTTEPRSDADVHSCSQSHRKRETFSRYVFFTAGWHLVLFRNTFQSFAIHNRNYASTTSTSKEVGRLCYCNKVDFPNV